MRGSIPSNRQLSLGRRATQEVLSRISPRISLLTTAAIDFCVFLITLDGIR